MRYIRVLSIVSLVVLLGGFVAQAQETPPAQPPAEQQPAQPPAQQQPAQPPAPATPPAPAGPMVEKAQVICDGKVKSDGVVELVVTPQGGAPAQIRVTLQKKMDKQEVCRDVAKELSVALGEKFKVDDGGDKVTIEAKEKHAKFSISIGAMTATGSTIQIKLK